MASIVNRIRGAKTTHKLIVPPTAVASVGATYYLVNLVKASLDSSSASQPPKVQEETVHPEEATPAPHRSSGTVDKETNDSEAGSSDQVQGDQGVNQSTQSTTKGDKQVAPESPNAPSTQPESVLNTYSNPTTETEKPKEKQDEQRRDSGASQTGDGTPDAQQKTIKLEEQLPLLMHLVDEKGHLWVFDLSTASLDSLHHQNYVVKNGLPLLRAAQRAKLPASSKPSTPAKTT